MSLINPDKCHYEDKTSAVRNLIRSCDLDWNELLQPSQDFMRFQIALDSHFECLEQVTRFEWFRPKRIEVIHGDWDAAQKRRQSLFTVPASSWRFALSGLISKSESKIKASKQLHCLIKPPIWDYPEFLNVVNPIFARHDLLPHNLEPYKHDHAWRIMCDLDHLAHDAILYELANEGTNCNPFEELMKVYGAGGFPIDCEEEAFYVLVP